MRQLNKARMIGNGKRGLGSKDLERFDRGTVRPQTITRGIHADQTQRSALVIFQWNDQEIIRIPGGGRNFGDARLLHADHVHICWDDRCFIHRDEVGTADLELRLEHLLNAGERLLA